MTEIVDLVQRLSVWCLLLICPPVLVMLYYCSQFSYFLCMIKIVSCCLRYSHLHLVLLNFLYISSMIGVVVSVLGVLFTYICLGVVCCQIFSLFYIVYLFSLLVSLCHALSMVF